MRRVLGWLAPALLVVVALLQIQLTTRTSLSPWKLGGFGMYSGVDAIGARWIRSQVVTPMGTLPVSFGRLQADVPGLETFSRNVRSWPDPASLGALGQALLAGDRVWADCTPASLQKTAGEGTRISGHFVRLLSVRELRQQGCRRLPVKALRLEVWRYRYTSFDRRLAGEKLAEVVVTGS